MAGDIWRSREAELISKYAERLVPIEDEESDEKKNPPLHLPGAKSTNWN